MFWENDSTAPRTQLPKIAVPWYSIQRRLFVTLDQLSRR